MYFLVLSLVLMLPLELFAGAPQDHVKTHILSLQEILLDPNLAGEANMPKRRALARVLLNRLFDFEEMARRSLGSNARKHSNKVPEFTPLFISLLEHNYMGEIEANGDVKIIYSGERIDGEYSEVTSRAKLRSGEEYKVSYKLHFKNNSWRVYDLSVEDISITNSYRSQFTRYLAKNSFDDLLNDLRSKKERFN